MDATKIKKLESLYETSINNSLPAEILVKLVRVSKTTIYRYKKR